ncbi:hypothetical protein AVO45_17310 [Ruegeria marisrubri]|uniref:C4-dicarboxylate ABC transporter n=2 Tax=Ruegeria marisrubri TaxID=1685379 RepID=A0A0X3UDI5_9RHOB|nr:hypothetical protein AVO45_17310 [Ruegeria marisrubri]
MGDLTGDDIQIKMFEPGEIVPPFSVLDAVAEGKVPAGLAVTAYSAGSFPGLSLLTTGYPFGLDTRGIAGWYYVGGGKEITQKLLNQAGVHGFMCIATASEAGGWHREPIETVDDFKGLNFRVGGIGGAVLNKLGASTTTLPFGESFSALEKGVIDGAELSLPSVDSVLGVQKIAKYLYFPGWHTRAAMAHFVVNLDVWNGLTATQQAQIEDACDAVMLKHFVVTDSLQSDALRKIEEAGVSLLTYPDDVLAALRTASEEVMAEQSAADEGFKEVYESMRAYHESLGTWINLRTVPEAN